MSFDIHCDLFDGAGGLDETAAAAYQDELLRRFVDSPEAKTIGGDDTVGGWVQLLFEYGLGHLGAGPATMDAGDVEELVFDLFPRKVSCAPDDAPAIVAELSAFFAFLAREFQLPAASACRAVLDRSDAAARLRRELANPANYGMAKSFFMGGQAAGFDMTSDDGRNAWMKTFNARLNAAHRVFRSVGPEERARQRNRRKRERRRSRGKR